jgi:hypothetical protein
VVGQSHGDQRRLQSVLEWEAHPEVGGQAKGRDQLGGADPLAGLWLSVHAATLSCSILSEEH